MQVTQQADSEAERLGTQQPSGWKAEKDRPLLPEVIEQLGFGLAQVRAGISGGGVYFADGAELLLISAVADAVQSQWGMTNMEKGLVVTLVFVGILIGNLISGPMADTYGRRQLILVSYFGIFVFSIISSFTVNVWGLCIVRLLVGMAFGLGQPAWNTLGAEMTPADWRIAIQGFTQGFFIVGEIFSCLLLFADDPTLEHLNWRRLLQLGAIPSAVFFILALFFLQQSPAFLSVMGRREEALVVLDSMRHDNRVPDVSVEFRTATSPSQLPEKIRRNSRRISWHSKGDVWRQLRVIFGPDLWYSTLICMYSCFTLNFLYYGCLYAFPQVLAKKSTMGAAMELLLGACWEIPGEILGIGLGMWLTRKLNMKIYLFFTCLSVVLFVAGYNSSTSVSGGIQMTGYFGIKCFVDLGFVVIYQYSIEIYPTKVRTTGSAISVGSGRLAGIISPLIFEAIKGHMSASVFFYVLVVLTLVNLLMIDLLKYETFGVALKDHLEDDEAKPRVFEAEVRQDVMSGEISPLASGSEPSVIVPEPFVPR